MHCCLLYGNATLAPTCPKVNFAPLNPSQSPTPNPWGLTYPADSMQRSLCQEYWHSFLPANSSVPGGLSGPAPTTIQAVPCCSHHIWSRAPHIPTSMTAHPKPMHCLHSRSLLHAQLNALPQVAPPSLRPQPLPCPCYLPLIPIAPPLPKASLIAQPRSHSNIVCLAPSIPHSCFQPMHP